MIGKLPEVKLNQEVTYRLLEEIEERVNNGFRLRTDFEILINFAKQVIKEKHASETW